MSITDGVWFKNIYSYVQCQDVCLIQLHLRHFTGFSSFSISKQWKCSITNYYHTVETCLLCKPETPLRGQRDIKWESPSVRLSYQDAHAVFHFPLLITLTGSSPGPAGKAVLLPPVHTAACQGDRPETRQEHFLYILNWSNKQRRTLKKWFPKNKSGHKYFSQLQNWKILFCQVTLLSVILLSIIK